MVKNTERVSVSISISVLQRVNDMAEDQNRNRSNVIDTILKDYFDLGGRKKRPLAKGLSS